MKADTIFSELLKALIPDLRKHGFSKSGQTFYLKRDANWGVINFQRSIKSRTSRIFFTVNLGVASGILLQFFGVRRKNKPLIQDCHWYKRLGELLPEKQDMWWILEDEASIEQLVEEMRSYILNLAIPEIKHYICDEALRDIWLSGKSPGLTDFERLRNLSVMLKTIGSIELLDKVLGDLERIAKDRISASAASYHIQKLRKGVSGEPT